MYFRFELKDNDGIGNKGANDLKFKGKCHRTYICCNSRAYHAKIIIVLNTFGRSYLEISCN